MAECGAAKIDLGPDDDLTNLFVLKVVFDAVGSNELVSIWRNPAYWGAEPPPDAINSSFDLAFDRIAFGRFAPSPTTHLGEFDAIRFGSSFASVTPIPEPATALLLTGASGCWRGADDYAPTGVELAPRATGCELRVRLRGTLHATDRRPRPGAAAAHRRGELRRTGREE